MTSPTNEETGDNRNIYIYGKKISRKQGLNKESEYTYAYAEMESPLHIYFIFPEDTKDFLVARKMQKIREGELDTKERWTYALTLLLVGTGQLVRGNLKRRSKEKYPF